jgi:hypothetical protein
LVLAAAAAGLALGLPAANALWSQQVEAQITVNYGVVGFAADRMDLTDPTARALKSTCDLNRRASCTDGYTEWDPAWSGDAKLAKSTANGRGVSAQLLEADAVALQSNNPTLSSPNTLYIPYTVTSLARGNSRLYYVGQLDWTDSDGNSLSGVTSGATAVLALLTGSEECTAANAPDLSDNPVRAVYDPADPTATIPVSKTANGADYGDQVAVEQEWCLKLTYPGTSGSYENLASTTVDTPVGPRGPDQLNDTWSVDLLYSTDAVDQLIVSFHPQVSRWDKP